LIPCWVRRSITNGAGNSLLSSLAVEYRKALEEVGNYHISGMGETEALSVSQWLRPRLNSRAGGDCMRKSRIAGIAPGAARIDGSSFEHHQTSRGSIAWHRHFGIGCQWRVLRGWFRWADWSAQVSKRVRGWPCSARAMSSGCSGAAWAEISTSAVTRRSDCCRWGCPYSAESGPVRSYSPPMTRSR